MDEVSERISDLTDRVKEEVFGDLDNAERVSRYTTAILTALERIGFEHISHDCLKDLQYMAFSLSNRVDDLLEIEKLRNNRRNDHE